MEWRLNKDRPLCPQICEQICLWIALGSIAPGQKLFSVREAAVTAGVNPNTVQRSFEMLEQQGILYSQRGSGWYACSDISAAQRELDRLRKEKAAAYIDEMKALGLDKQEAVEYLQAQFAERKEDDDCE